MQYTSYEINAINKFPNLPPKQAIAEYKKLSAKGGAKAKGRTADWAYFKNKEVAREAGKKGKEIRWGNIKKES